MHGVSIYFIFYINLIFDLCNASSMRTETTSWINDKTMMKFGMFKDLFNILTSRSCRMWTVHHLPPIICDGCPLSVWFTIGLIHWYFNLIHLIVFVLLNQLSSRSLFFHIMLYCMCGLMSLLVIKQVFRCY